MSTPNTSPSDLVATWELPYNGQVHKIEFEHGTTSGKRIVRVDDKEVVHKDWMFKLVGSETFELHEGQVKCEILINASYGFSYDYTLLVNGKQLRKFKERQVKLMKTWDFTEDNKRFTIALEKESLDVWCNGVKLDTKAEFVDEGTEITFVLLDLPQVNVRIRTISSGNKREGIIYTLLVGDREIAETIQ